MSSRLTRNFATNEDLEKLGILDAELYDSVTAILPLVAPFIVDGQAVIDQDRVLFSNLAAGNLRIYQATIIGLVISWTDITFKTLEEDQKILVHFGTLNQKNIMQVRGGAVVVANEGLNPAGGEANTSSNAGAGGAGTAALAKAKVGVDLPFRRLKQGSNITVTELANEVQIDSTGEPNTSSNAGAGGAGIVDLAKAKVGVDLPFRRLKQGTNVTLTQNADDVEIAVPAVGEANTSSNAGAGGAGIVDLAKAKVGVDLPFRRLKQGTNVTLTQNADDVEIAVPAVGEANTSSNAGAGGAGIVDLAKAKVGVDLPFRRLKQGTNVTLTQNADDVEIAVPAVGEANTSSNAGAGGAGIVDLAKAKVGVDLPFRRLKQGTNVTLTQNADDVEIAVPAVGEANTSSNAGAGGAGIASLAKAKVGVDLPFRRLKQGTNITVTENADDVEIANIGAPARITGTATLVAGTVTVAHASVQAGSRIFLTAQNSSGTWGDVRVDSRVVGVSFTILSSNDLDTSDVAWEIYNP